MAKFTETVGVGAINTISQGTEIKGNVKDLGDFRMDGTLEGDIVPGDIRGKIICQNANIIGNVCGNLTVKELLCLHATAVVKGDIVINKLSIEPGAQFEGTCRMYQESVRYNYAEPEPAANDNEE